MTKTKLDAATERGHDWKFFADDTARCRRCGRSVHSAEVPFSKALKKEHCKGATNKLPEAKMTTEADEPEPSVPQGMREATQAPTVSLTYEQEVHALLHAAAASTEDLLRYFEAQAAQETGEAKKLTKKCIEWKRHQLGRIRALIPQALERRDIPWKGEERGRLWESRQETEATDRLGLVYVDDRLLRMVCSEEA